MSALVNSELFVFTDINISDRLRCRYMIEQQLVQLGMTSALINIPVNGTMLPVQRQSSQPPWTVWWLTAAENCLVMFAHTGVSMSRYTSLSQHSARELNSSVAVDLLSTSPTYTSRTCHLSWTIYSWSSSTITATLIDGLINFTKLCEVNADHCCSCLGVSLPVKMLLMATVQKTTRQRVQKRHLCTKGWFFHWTKCASKLCVLIL